MTLVEALAKARNGYSHTGIKRTQDTVRWRVTERFPGGDETSGQVVAFVVQDGRRVDVTELRLTVWDIMAQDWELA